jgi:hypothetical protein
MKIAAISFVLGLVALLPAQAQEYGLPSGAVTIETQAVKTDRSLVLWMVNPTKHPRETPDEPYTCPEYTRGSYYSGPTRVSLVDTKSRKVINTVKVRQDYNEGEDEFDVPYQIRSDYYYHVEGAAEGKEGQPAVMWLKDYNGDGTPLEFALFDAQACMGLATTLIGYNEREDKVIQYQTRLAVTSSKGKRSTLTSGWVDYLFSKKPESPGFWKYEIDYRGRGGDLAKYEIRYNKETAKFEGKLVEQSGE